MKNKPNDKIGYNDNVILFAIQVNDFAQIIQAFNVYLRVNFLNSKSKLWLEMAINEVENTIWKLITNDIPIYPTRFNGPWNQNKITHQLQYIYIYIYIYI